MQLQRNNKYVFSFLRQLTTWNCPHLLLRAVCRAAAPLLLHAGRAAIDRYLLPAGFTAANTPLSIDGTDGRTDTRGPIYKISYDNLTIILR